VQHIAEKDSVDGPLRKARVVGRRQDRLEIWRGVLADDVEQLVVDIDG
jgi:hypothetical protein